MIDLSQFFDSHRDEFVVLGRVVMAALLGGVVGFEREMKDRPAGLRTHVLVAAAACLLISLGKPLILNFQELNTTPDMIRSDPTRLIEAIIAGVAFLGAGTIIRKEGGGVRGLTTAASILVAAVIGISVAIGLWVTACGVAMLSVMLLLGLHSLEGAIRLKQKE